MPQDLEWILNAFHLLGSARQFGFGVGPIPYPAIELYCESEGLTREERTEFVHLIRVLDGEYLKHANERKKPSDGTGKSPRVPG